METSSSCGAWGKKVSPLPTAWGPWPILELWDMVARGFCTGLGTLQVSELQSPPGHNTMGWDRLAPSLLPPIPAVGKCPPSPVPGLRKPHNLTSHSLPRRSFVFFPSRGFLWGWALRGYSFLLGRGCVLGKGPSSAFCPSEPLEPPLQHRTPAAPSVTPPGAPQTTLHPVGLVYLPGPQGDFSLSPLPCDFRLSQPHRCLWFGLRLHFCFPCPALSWRPFLGFSPLNILDVAVFLPVS